MIDYVELRQFRNHQKLRVEFGPETNLIAGPNGSGKTSILEAIHTTLGGNSWRGSVQNLISDDCDWATVELKIDDKSYQLQLDNRSGSLVKTRLIDGQPRRSGFPALVLLEPMAIQLVNAGPSGRRDWLDSVLIGVDRQYGPTLKRYNRALSQRNALLKQAVRNPDQLFVWNIKLAELGAQLASQRQQLINYSLAEVNRLFEAVAGYSKGLSVSYAAKFDTSDYSQLFMNYLEANLERDIAIGFTPAGPHREDVELLVDGGPATDHLSRGEQLILTFSLMYSQAEQLQPAAVLLDDFASELDKQRTARLLEVIDQQKLVATADKASLPLPNKSSRLAVELPS